MIHELDCAIRDYIASGALAASALAVGGGAHPGRTPCCRDNLSAGPFARPMQSSTIRVLETTWRLWREPQS